MPRVSATEHSHSHSHSHVVADYMSRHSQVGASNLNTVTTIPGLRSLLYRGRRKSRNRAGEALPLAFQAVRTDTVYHQLDCRLGGSLRAITKLFVW